MTCNINILNNKNTSLKDILKKNSSNKPLGELPFMNFINNFISCNQSGVKLDGSCINKLLLLSVSHEIYSSFHEGVEFGDAFFDNSVAFSIPNWYRTHTVPKLYLYLDYRCMNLHPATNERELRLLELSQTQVQFQKLNESTL